MRSLRLRLVAGAVVGILLALTLAGFVLVGLFEAHVRDRYQKELDDHLLQLVALLALDPTGKSHLTQDLPDPAFRRPFSGHYWQVRQGDRDLLRSRSLWDNILALPPTPPPAGQLRATQLTGPRQQRLLVIERLIELPAAAQRPLRVAVAGETAVIDEAKRGFARVVVLSLASLGVLLAAASWLQIGAGLAPLRTLRHRLEDMRTGRSARVDGDYPVEVIGLVDDLNRLIDTQAREVERARINAAKLGHGLKTPLAVLAAEARSLRASGGASAAESIETEIDAMNAHVARALAAARAVGRRPAVGAKVDAMQVLDRLVSVMKRLPGGEHLAWTVSGSGALDRVPVHQRDLEELAGNLLDNARKWARTTISVAMARDGETLVLTVDDDGPSIPADRIEDVLARGIRLDRSVPGSGVGLAIVRDLADLHDGGLTLSQSPAGGLRAQVRLSLSAPAATRHASPA